MNRFKELRLKAGYKSQKELAKILFVNQTAVSQWERGITTPSSQILLKLSDLYGVSTDFLLGRSDYPDAPPSTGGGWINVSGISAPPETIKKPRLGAIACGQPILAEEHIDEYDDVPVTIRCDFTLLCVGDSMTGAGIQDGDVVYIRQQPVVENGEIAAVIIDGEATLKRFRRVNDTVMLLPENPNFEPLIYNDNEINGIQIIGKAVGFTREFKK